MPDRTSATEGGYQEGSAGDGYFAPLASARRMMLTTFKPDGGQASAAVHGVVDGGRAYFRAWSHSGTVENLRHTDEVQVAPCTALGLLLLAPPLDAVARPLPDGEARPGRRDTGPQEPGWAAFPGPAASPGAAPAGGLLRALDLRGRRGHNA